MANISAIKLPSGNIYNIVDKTSGYITVETDPVFTASPAYGISASDISSWNAKQNRVYYTTVNLSASGWSNKQQTVNVSGVTTNNLVIAEYAPSSKDAWSGAGIYASSQGNGTITFTCDTVPSVQVSAVVVVID